MSNVTHPSQTTIVLPAQPMAVPRVEQGFESIIASRWIQAPLYAGLIIMECLVSEIEGRGRLAGHPGADAL